MTLSLIGALDYAATPSSSDDFDITGADEVVLILDGVSSPGAIGTRLSSDGGATFPDTAGDYLDSSWNFNSGASDVNSSFMNLMSSGVAETNVNTVQSLSALQAGHPGQGWTTGVKLRSSTAALGMAHARTKDASVGPFDRLRLVCPAGNMTAGTARLYKRTGVLTLIGELDYAVTASASDDFNITGADDVLLLMQGISPAGTYGVRLSDDGGLTFYDTIGNYVISATGHNAQTANADSNMMDLAALSAASTHGVSQLFGLQAAYPAHLVGCNTEAVGVPGIQHHRTGASVVGPFTHMRLIALSGNRTAGKVSVWKWA